MPRRRFQYTIMYDADNYAVVAIYLQSVIAHTSSLTALKSLISFANRNNAAELLKLVKLATGSLMRTCSIDVGEIAKTPQKYIDPSTASGRSRAVCMPWELCCDVLVPCTTTNDKSYRTIFELAIKTT